MGISKATSRSDLEAALDSVYAAFSRAYAAANVQILMDEVYAPGAFYLSPGLPILEGQDESGSEDQAELFTKFYRADDRNTREVSGTGIGLVTCKQIVDLHGGEISLESEVDRGTTVTFRVPARAAAELAEVLPDAA